VEVQLLAAVVATADLTLLGILTAHMEQVRAQAGSRPERLWAVVDSGVEKIQQPAAAEAEGM
jgi:hypothetical protein